MTTVFLVTHTYESGEDLSIHSTQDKAYAKIASIMKKRMTSVIKKAADRKELKALLKSGNTQEAIALWGDSTDYDDEFEIQEYPLD